jgi:hypothetical protein
LFIAYADLGDDMFAGSGVTEFAGDSALAGFASAAYNAGYTEPAGRDGVISRKTVDGRRERVFLTASANRPALDAYRDYAIAKRRLLGDTGYPA